MKARRGVVEVPASNIKKEITRVLYEQGYICSYHLDDQASPQGMIKIVLKYGPDNRQPAIVKLQRVSKPGLRKYARCGTLPEVINGLGIAVVSTPQGVMSDKEARKKRVGGEVLCYVY